MSKLLPLWLFVEKFVEAARPGCHYETDNGLIYRTREGQSEDVATLPEDVAVVKLGAVDLAVGEFVGDPDVVARLGALQRQMESLAREVDAILRS